MMTNNTTTATYQAISDVNIKYTYKFGGGIKVRTVKAGDIVTVIGKSIEIDTPCVSCLELLYKITASSFIKFFKPVPDFQAWLQENEHLKLLNKFYKNPFNEGTYQVTINELETFFLQASSYYLNTFIQKPN